MKFGLVLAGIGLVSILGLLSGAFPQGDVVTESESLTEIEAVVLAQRIIQQHPPHYLVDLRDTAACEQRRLYGAMCLSPDDPEGRFLADLPPTRDLVL